MICRAHRRVQQDIYDLVEYYERAAGPALGDAFYAELMALMAVAGEHPTRFHFGAPGLRRANLREFPVHFLYEVRPTYVFVTVVRHHKRHPAFGLHRQ